MNVEGESGFGMGRDLFFDGFGRGGPAVGKGWRNKDGGRVVVVVAYDDVCLKGLLAGLEDAPVRVESHPEAVAAEFGVGLVEQVFHHGAQLFAPGDNGV